MKQVWGYDAAGPSGYTKEIALFHDFTANKWEIRVRPALASPEIVIPMSPDAAAALRDVLSGYSPA